MAQHPATKPLNPQRLDVAALADRTQHLQGQWPLADLPRLNEPGEPPATPGSVLEWTAHAERRPVRGAPPELWLHLQAQAEVLRTCQRCLQPVALPLQVRRSFLFAATEAQAEAWDAERDDADVLVLTKSLDLQELVEDELLLALPLVPRHEQCPQPLVAPLQASPTDEVSPEPDNRDNPFSILAQLKRSN